MATLSKYQDQGFKIYRKGDTLPLPKVTYSQYGGACYEDDGYDDVDAMNIVAMLKHHIDQGQSGYFREIAGFSTASAIFPVSQELHDKWLNEPMPPEGFFEDRYYDKPPKKKAKKEKPKVDVTRTVPKVIEPPKPVKKYTAQEDAAAVEEWIGWIEHTDNMEIIRTPESVQRIAGWIREDEHIYYRYKHRISLSQVRGILKEFQQ